EAEEGEGGLLKAFDERPALVLTDLSMPGMDGFELICHLRHGPEFKNLKIIALTGQDGGYVEAAERAGADVVLQKPTDLDDLAEVIERLFTPEGSMIALQ